MIAAALAVLATTAASPPPTMMWSGKANVYFDGQTIPIRVRTTLSADGVATSESWPEQLGEAKGLRRMIVRPRDGETQVGGKIAPLAPDQLFEEQAQFGIYRQIQEAAGRAIAATAQGADTLSVAGVTRSWFKLRGDEVVGAFNWLPVGAGGAAVRQDFSFDGWLKVGEVQFPRHMVLNRNGKPYFELWVDTFDAR